MLNRRLRRALDLIYDFARLVESNVDIEGLELIVIYDLLELQAKSLLHGGVSLYFSLVQFD